MTPEQAKRRRQIFERARRDTRPVPDAEKMRLAASQIRLEDLERHCAKLGLPTSLAETLQPRLD